MSDSFSKIIFNNPKTLNALDLNMIHFLILEIYKLSNQNAVWIEGAGVKAFCAGGDIKSLYGAKISKDP